MPGSGDTRTGPEARLVRRFSRTERLLHWTNALGFFFLLASGLVLYVPALSIAIGRRLLIQRLHFYAGLVWIGALARHRLLGDRRGFFARPANSTLSTATTCAGCSGGVPHGRAGSTPGRRSTRP